MSPSGRRTDIMVDGNTKIKAPELWKTSENSINRRRTGARKVGDSKTAFHPLVGDTSARAHTSAHSHPTKSFEGSTEGSAQGSSGVGHDPAPDQDGISEEHNVFDDASDEDDSSGVEADLESSGELPSVYDNIQGYPGIGTTLLGELW